MQRTRLRVNTPLLVLCLLEVVLWSACLSSANSLNAGTAYLQRETGNLKLFTSDSAAPRPLDELWPSAALLAETEWEHTARQDALTAVAACPVALVADLDQLRALLLEDQGLPAPFTGIAAID